MNTSGTSVDLTPTVLNEILNEALTEGFDVITNKWLDYATGLSDISIVADEDTYPLPADFYKMRVVWLQQGDRYKRLHPVDLDSAHRYAGKTGGVYRYRITNRNLVFMPTPSGAETVRIFYVPQQPELVNDYDTVTLDVPIELKYILAIGWREILDRQNLDPSPAITKVQQYGAMLRVSADSLDAGEPFYLDGGAHGDDCEDW